LEKNTAPYPTVAGTATATSAVASTAGKVGYSIFYNALSVGLGLRQVHHAATLFPLSALFEQINALETFQNVALGRNGAGGTKAAMLGHKALGLKGNAHPSRTAGKYKQKYGAFLASGCPIF
jgi:hypothetical protein